MARPMRAPARASASTIARVACVWRPPAAVAATTCRRGGSRSASTATLRSRAVSSLGEAGDERDREAGGDHPAGRERVVALERDPRLEAGLAAELADQARARSRTGPGSRRRRAARPARSRRRRRAGGGAARPRTSIPRAACAPRRPRAPRAPTRRNVTATSMSPRPSLASAFGGPHSETVTSASGIPRCSSATASGTSLASDEECAAIRTRRCSPREQLADLELGQRQPVERGAGVLDQQRAGRGQLRPAARAVDERRADLGLERREVLGDRGLGEVERGGGAGQRAGVGDRDQRAEAPHVVHKCSLSMNA